MTIPFFTAARLLVAFVSVTPRMFSVTAFAGRCTQGVLVRPFFLVLVSALILSGCAAPFRFLGISGDEGETVSIFPQKGESLREIPTQPFRPEVADGELDAFRSFVSDFGLVTAVSLSPNGDMFYVGGEDGSLHQYRLTSSRKIEDEVVFKSDRPVLALALSPNGERVAIGQTSQVIVYDLKERKQKHVMTLVKGRITALEWDPRGELIGIGAASGEIFIWSLREGFFEGQGRNSHEALELYKGGRSPIVEIRFHPSGGTFFSAENDGVVSLWRLMRTEREIGLRDDFAVSDQHRETSRRQVLGTISSRVSDLWLDGEGRTLYASAGDGGVYAWKVRGLRLLAKVDVARDEQFTVTGYTASRGEFLVDLVFTAGRDQRVTLLCMKRNALQRGGDDAEGTPPKVEARSGLLRAPIGKLRGGVKGILWGAEKGDRLWVFDADRFFATEAGERILNRCEGPAT